MPLTLTEDAFGNLDNATALASASDLAYLSGAAGVAAFKEQLGLDARLIEVGHTQCWLAASEGHVVCAFRGTEAPTTIDGLKDWLLADAMNLLILPQGRLGTDFAAAGVDARFHAGFIEALGAIWDPVYEGVAAQMKKEDRPLWITGHSLGGALALLAAWLFDRRTVNVHQVYTFGAPMIGNRVAAAAIDRAFAGKIYRYVNLSDPVPLLPRMSLAANDYVHCEKAVDLGREGAEGAGALLTGFASQAVEGVLSGQVLEDLWASVRGRIAAHGLDQYRQALKDRFGV